MTLRWQHSYTSKMTYKPSKLGHTDLVSGLWLEFCAHTITSRRIAVMIRATLVNMHIQQACDQLYY